MKSLLIGLVAALAAGAKPGDSFAIMDANLLEVNVAAQADDSARMDFIHKKFAEIQQGNSLTSADRNTLVAISEGRVSRSGKDSDQFIAAIGAGAAAQGMKMATATATLVLAMAELLGAGFVSIITDDYPYWCICDKRTFEDPNSKYANKCQIDGDATAVWLYSCSQEARIEGRAEWEAKRGPSAAPATTPTATTPTAAAPSTPTDTAPATTTTA